MPAPAANHSAVPAQPPAPAQLAAPVLEFDVAAIRQNKADDSGRSHIYSSAHDGNFRAVNVTLLQLLQNAYALPATQILGGPPWLKSNHFDVDAKAESSVDAWLNGLDPDEARAGKRKMLQGLLADRFQLTAHDETRELPIYALVVAKNGPRLTKSQANGTSVNSRNGQISVTGGDNTVAVLAERLATELGRVVVDKTGIQGRYELTLKWTPDEAANGAGKAAEASASAADSGPSLFTAIQEQLGLKLESAKGPVKVLVIDRIEMPSAN